MYQYVELKEAVKDWSKIKLMSKSVQIKWKTLFDDITERPREKNTIGRPEQLKHTRVEVWSRELTKKDRIVYGIEPGINYGMPEENEIVVFYQYLGHYDDK